MKSQITKFISIFPIIIASNASANYADVKLTHIKPNKSEAQWIREKQVTPIHPVELAMKGVTGCGVFRVTVNESGNNDNIELVSSIPKKGIYKPAKKVIKKWKWKNASGQPNTIEQKLIRLDFFMGGKTQADSKARCEEQAKMQCRV